MRASFCFIHVVIVIVLFAANTVLSNRADIDKAIEHSDYESLIRLTYDRSLEHLGISNTPARSVDFRLHEAIVDCVGGEDECAIMEALDRGADINAIVSNSIDNGKPSACTPLTRAILAITSVWSFDDEALNQTSTETPAEEAVLPVVQTLVDNGADVNKLSVDGISSLGAAVMRGFGEVASLLIERGALINHRNNAGLTPLALAVITQNATIVELLLESGADPNVVDTLQQTALHWAISSWSDSSLVLDLLIHGADPTIENTSGRTASEIQMVTLPGVHRLMTIPELHMCALRGDTVALREILSGNDRPSVLIRPSLTPLQFAVVGGHTAAVNILLEEGHDINDKSDGGITPLMLAAQHGDVEIAELLLNHGNWIDWILGDNANIQAADESGRTALHHAVVANQRGVINLLVAEGAELEVADDQGMTPLHHACILGDTAIARSLIELGADPMAKDNEGRTSLDLAAAHGRFAVVQYLAAIMGEVRLKSAETEMSKGDSLDAIGETDEAFKKHLLAAGLGDAKAMNIVGARYKGGHGIARSDTEAYKWFLESARRDCIEGAYNLATMYRDGSGVEKDCKKAESWMLKAMKQGHKRAKVDLGIMYYFRGVCDVGCAGYEFGKDKYQMVTVDWFEELANEGYHRAQFGMCLMYYNGKSVKKDRNTALEWERKAANQGYVPALIALAEEYENGSSYCKQDLRKAAELYKAVIDKTGCGVAEWRLRDLGN